MSTTTENITNETESLKTVFIKSTISIFQSCLPFIVVMSSVSITILQFLNQNCSVDPAILEYISPYNNTMIGSIASTDNLGILSKVIVVINFVFGLLMGLYGGYLKKTNTKYKLNNTFLTEEVTKLTEQNIMMRFGSEYGINSSNGDPLNASTSTGYPTALDITTPKEEEGNNEPIYETQIIIPV